MYFNLFKKIFVVLEKDFDILGFYKRSVQYSIGTCKHCWLGFSGGSRGRRQRAPPQESRFFHFDIQIFQNVAASGVGAPYEVGAPLRDPSLGLHMTVSV